MINTVVFDFVNTLAYLNPKREDVIYNFLTEKDINISKSKIVDALKIADDQCHYSCFEIVDKKSKKNFFQTKYNKALLTALEIDYTNRNCVALYDYFDKIYKGEISKKTNKNLVNVFVPTTPNPTSGFLLMFPKDEIKYLDMTFEEASKFIVSAGTSNPKN